jgi:adenylate cyclase
VVFVTGGAGRGKTALVEEFARRAQDAHPDLLAVAGHCNAYSGVGDPYLPFREVLATLTGDVEAQWSVGAITREHARRLWHTLPLACKALVEDGPDLIDTFVRGTALQRRAVACAWESAEGEGWLARLGELVERKAAAGGAVSAQQSDLMEQCARVLGRVARPAPLLLLLDDLQWADPGSIGLLFYLGKKLAGERILIVGAYRPAEVAAGRAGERHPLETVVNEIRRAFGDMIVDLGRAEGWDFLEAFLDSVPNRLGETFRETLYRQTAGHPLFTVELLREMQERGDLVQDEAGCWVEGPTLDWQQLPTQVEAAIAERVSRLAEPSQEMLRVASVEGETFTAEVVARVCGANEWETVRRLSGELDKRHRLVRPRRVQRTGTARLSRYRFRHFLFQHYLYHSLDEVERAFLHEKVGNALEALYGGESGEIAIELARHFQTAGLPERAVGYWRQAGERAVRVSASEEAVAHFNRALATLEVLPDTPERARQELELLIRLANPLYRTVKDWSGEPRLVPVYARARELYEQVGEPSQLFPVQWLLTISYVLQAEYHRAHEIGEQLLSLAQGTEDPALLAMAHLIMGMILYLLGEFDAALAHTEQVVAFYDPQKHRSLILLFGYEPRVSSLGYASFLLFMLGYPDQALKRIQEALALAREADQTEVLRIVLYWAMWIHRMCGEEEAVKESFEAFFTLTTAHPFGYYRASTTAWRGEMLVKQGRVEEGIAQMRQALAAHRATGAKDNLAYRLAWVAEVFGKVGQAEEGLTLLAEALAHVERTGERLCEAEIHRLKGELLLTRSEAAAGAEACFRQAIAVARRQSARSWELRATMSLCRLWEKQGKREEARRMLAEIYGWFTEGFDTRDLREARALLEELS